jgi:oligoendopeptidase F
MLFIQYAKDYIDGMPLDLVTTEFFVNSLYTIVLATQVNCFEQAVYLDYYDSEEIMADGTITADEYDDLFAAISIDFGIEKDYRVDHYWRYVTISSPCYYISYAVSGVNALQIYTKVDRQGFEAAKESYLKLFTYTDENPDMTLEEILEYAGLTSYTDEETFEAIYHGLR